MNPLVRATTDPTRREACITTHFPCDPDEVWSLFSDPAKLTRWWGPPEVPMRLDRHDLRSGGRVELVVDFPSGEQINAQWSIIEADPPRRLHFRFSSDGIDPTTIEVTIGPSPDGKTAMTLIARFDSPEHYEHAVDIGFDRGLRNSVDNAHAVIASAG